LSQERVLKTLTDIGFSQADAQVYLFLSRKGPQKGRAISKSLNMNKQQLYPCLKNLQSKGIVNATIEFPARFSAVPFETVIDFFIKAKMEEARLIQQSKERILSDWQSIAIGEMEETSAKFTVLKGRSTIYSKIQLMMQETKNQISTITTIPSLIQAEQRDIFDTTFSHPSKSKILFRFLVELSDQNIHAMKNLLKETAEAKFNVEGRNPDLGLTLFPQMLVRDEDEALFFVNPRTETSIIKHDDVCLWTNCKTLVQAFIALFEELWQNSTNIQEKIFEIETGKPTPKTCVIGDAEIAKKKYNKAMQLAKEEILIMTSSEGLVEFWANSPQANEWTEKGVVVKIMAPIVNENLEAARQLSKLCSVKHAPLNSLSTTIIDGKHLFQFKTSTPEKQPLGGSLHFKNTLYTNNLEYVQKTKAMLTEQWKNARPPDAENLKSIYPALRSVACYPGAIRGPEPHGTFHPLPPDPAKKSEYPVIEIVDDDPLGKLTEQDVLNLIVNAQKNPSKSNLWRFYASQAIAIIHPPDFFDLPPMLIRVNHVEKHSTLGAEDVIIINLWLETPNGPAYVPVAALVDSPKTQASCKASLAAALPASQNVRLAKKDELQIRVHGNTLFAGWTVPIPLLPSRYVLPPACMLIEGYGDVKTAAYTITNPWGGRIIAKQNSFDAFVTFMHPSSKYSGPGTDGLFVRDFIADVSPYLFKEHPPTLEHNVMEKRKP